MRIFYKLYICALLQKEPHQGSQLHTIFSCSFDKSLNRISLDEQMGTYVPCWGDENSMVKTKYLDTQFLMRPSADNRHGELPAALGDIPEQKMLQISMDGPKMNWRVFELLNSFRGGRGMA